LPKDLGDTIIKKTKTFAISAEAQLSKQKGGSERQKIEP
jgi:hypothetical protein